MKKQTKLTDVDVITSESGFRYQISGLERAKDYEAEKRADYIRLYAGRCGFEAFNFNFPKR